MAEAPENSLEKIFFAALKLPDSMRADYLDRACGEDEALKANIKALLVADGELEHLLGPAGLTTMSELDAVIMMKGQRIGSYAIRRQIAGGGMGIVYEAVQEKPRRTVALKVMKPGIASASALRRFEQESQILARLRHPNIAQVFEAGMHDDGSNTMPYFAMEYIPNAKTLVNYANEKKLSTGDRLSLFIKICDAVHHGNQKGIIHRDLKPDNILVDSSGEPKIIDFGVAKATDSDMAQTTHQTHVGQLIGTMRYMSPEQCEGDPHDLDARSDVYTLGVILYELLCDRLPYDLEDAAYYEAARVIREELPKKPSSINKHLRGNVEMITLAALEKDRTHRYQSAGELGQDIQRHLNGELPAIQPPSFIRVFKRQMRTHRRGVAIVSTALVALVIGFLIAPTRTDGMATLTVTARRVDANADLEGADVYIRKINIQTRQPEEARPLGKTPLNLHCVSPGYYRVIVKVDDDEFSEMTRYLEEEQSYTLNALIRPAKEVQTDMMFIEGGQAIVGMETDVFHYFKKRTVSLEAYWIDATEVSNRAYKAFLDDTNHPWPEFWGNEYRPAWDDLPVVGIGLNDAQSYAEWAGKRLPNDLEWERAGRGTGGRTFPWGSNAESIRQHANVFKSETKVWLAAISSSELRHYYEKSVSPVNQLPDGLMDRTPEGLYHMQGNVSEWTESMHFNVIGGASKPERYERIIKSDHWGRDAREYWDLARFIVRSIDSKVISCGFRCAKGAQP